METAKDLVVFCVENGRFPSRKEQGKLKAAIRTARMTGFTQGLPLEDAEALERSCESVAKIVLQSRRDYDAYLTERESCRATGILPKNPVALRRIFRKQRHLLAKEFRSEFPELATILRQEAKSSAPKEDRLVGVMRTLFRTNGPEAFVSATAKVLVENLHSTKPLDGNVN